MNPNQCRLPKISVNTGVVTLVNIFGSTDDCNCFTVLVRMAKIISTVSHIFNTRCCKKTLFFSRLPKRVLTSVSVREWVCVLVALLLLRVCLLELSFVLFWEPVPLMASMYDVACDANFL